MSILSHMSSSNVPIIYVAMVLSLKHSYKYVGSGYSLACLTTWAAYYKFERIFIFFAIILMVDACCHLGYCF